MKKIFTSTAMILYSFISFAQAGFVSTGGDASSSSGSVSYSVGQLDYNSYASSAHLVIEGLQQPVNLTIVPISLLYFSAAKGANHTVNLNWSTVSEYNNDYFTIERSKDGTNFTKMMDVDSRGNSNLRQEYGVVDYEPFDGYSYYRLKQTDIDSNFSYAQIEKVFFAASALEATAGPNPTTDFVHLYITGSIDKNMSYQLISINGAKLAMGKITSNDTPVNLENLPSSTYFLQIIKDKKTIKTFKIIKK